MNRHLRIVWRHSRMLACTALQRLDDGVDARRVGGASRDNNSLTMTTSSPGRWDVQPASPWISMRPLALIPLALFVVAIIIHTSAVLIGFAIATLGAATYLCLLLWSLRRADARRLAAAPPGVFYVGRGEARLRLLRADPRFAGMATGRRGIAVAGEIRLDESGVHFAPFGARSGSSAGAEIAWDNLTSLRASATPGKLNVGCLDLDTQDGGQLRLQIAGYSRLVAGLDRRCPSGSNDNSATAL